jgi:hypothetical protein
MVIKDEVTGEVGWDGTTGAHLPGAAFPKPPPLAAVIHLHRVMNYREVSRFATPKGYAESPAFLICSLWRKQGKPRGIHIPRKRDK